MGVVRHPGSIGVRRGPDRSIGGMRRQGPVDRFDEAVGEDLSLDARNPESVMDQEVLGAGLGSASDPAPQPEFVGSEEWRAQHVQSLMGAGGGSNPLGEAWDWIREAQIPQIPGLPGPDFEYLPRELNPNAWVEALNAGKQMALPLMPRDVGYSGYGADTPLPGAPKAVAPVLGAGVWGLRGLRGLRGADEVVDLGRAVGRAASPRPVVPMRPPAAPSTAATRAGRHGWVEPPPRLPAPSGRLGSVPSPQSSAAARAGRHGWVEPPSPRPPSPAVAGRLGSVRPPPTAGPPAGGVSRAARPTVGMQWRRSQGVPTQGSSVVPHSDELPWFTTNRMAGDVARAQEPGLDPTIRAIREQMAQGADPSKWQSSQYFDVGDSVSRYKSSSALEGLMSSSGAVTARQVLREWQPARARDAYWFAPEGAADWLRGNPVRFVNGDIPPEIAGQMSRTPRAGTHPISVEPRPGPGGYSVHKGDYIDWVNPDAGLGKGA